ncbi:hypothetical protein P4O66_006336 [Electrophorus voltai]|uniref:Tc1-like transposase DDE domain-containing protein n=1 Tax=Electrophorus voltai TaxID=2609070 RepID=A0AAD8ZKI5_9TELE|nr:hypothetical protein P4O66_006336 [Electrophorus voltai]
MAEVRSECICMHSEAKAFGGWMVSRRAAKKPLLSKKNIKGRLTFCGKYRDWPAEDWGEVIFSGEAPFRLFGTSGQMIVRRRKGEHYHESCLMPTVRHPETIHVMTVHKWFGKQNIEILGLWPGNSPDLHPIENLWSILKKRLDKQKHRNCDQLQALIRQEWFAISQDCARN